MKQIYPVCTWLMNTWTMPWGMMNLRQDPKVAVQSHPGQRQRVDQKLGKSKHQWNVFNLTLSFALYWTAIHHTQALTFRSQPWDTAVSRGAESPKITQFTTHLTEKVWCHILIEQYLSLESHTFLSFFTFVQLTKFLRGMVKLIKGNNILFKFAGG